MHFFSQIMDYIFYNACNFVNLNIRQIGQLKPEINSRMFFLFTTIDFIFQKVVESFETESIFKPLRFCLVSFYFIFVHLFHSWDEYRLFWQNADQLPERNVTIQPRFICIRLSVIWCHFRRRCCWLKCRLFALLLASWEEHVNHQRATSKGILVPHRLFQTES